MIKVILMLLHALLTLSYAVAKDDSRSEMIMVNTYLQSVVQGQVINYLSGIPHVIRVSTKLSSKVKKESSFSLPLSEIKFSEDDLLDKNPNLPEILTRVENIQVEISLGQEATEQLKVYLKKHITQS